MKKLRVSFVALVILALAGPPLLAQQQRQQRQRGGGTGGGGRDTVSLLTQKSVQDELKLSDDQVKKISELAATRRGTGRGGQNLSQEERQKRQEERSKANEKALAEILKPDQLKRAKQISWQQQSAQAVSDPEFATALKLTDEQKDKIKTIQADARQEGGQALQRGGNQDEARKRREALRKETQERMMSVLTADQKAKWKELMGEPFKGEITRPGGRGGNRAGRGSTPPSQH
jgi:Spy/CpxP family protein refolding chaperone